MAERVLKAALVQFARDRFNSDRNRRRAVDILSGVRGADIVCMPEVWMGGVVLDEDEMSSLLDELYDISTANGFTLITGGLFVRRGDVIQDIAHVIHPGEKEYGEQAKIFPSGAVSERQFCTGGDSIEIFECGGMKFGVAVCVDMFYPEIIRTMALSGAHIIFNPANIPAQRNEMWHSLVRTRSAENTIFTAYITNTGTEYADGRKVSGGSLAVGPCGHDIVRAGDEETVIRFDIDPALIAEQRNRWPYLDDASNMRQDGLKVHTEVARYLDPSVTSLKPE